MARRPFKQGDIVRKKRGWTPMVVTRPETSTGTLRVLYCGQPPECEQITRPQNLVLIEKMSDLNACSDLETRLTPKHKETLDRQTAGDIEKENEMTTKLYQTKEDTPRFGTKLAVNSEGKIVLEMKGDGNVEVFAKSEVEEVKPYTVAVRFLNEKGNSTEYQFLAVKGSVEVGDLILMEDYVGMARVTHVNTQSSRATMPLKGRKLATTPIATEDD